MKKDIFNMIVSVFVVIMLSKSFGAGELMYGDIAKCARASALGYKEKFKKLIKASAVSGDQQTVYSVTNGDANVSVVYFGFAQRLLSVDVKRSWATNETFRFSRQSGEITRYEAYDADCSVYELSYHTNGTLRSFVRIANARYQGKKYRFDLESVRPFARVKIAGGITLRALRVHLQ